MRLEVAAFFKGRDDCPSVYRLSATLRTTRGQVLVRQHRTGNTAADAWERVSMVLEGDDAAREVLVEVYGKDTLFWAGNFGAKVAGVSVRVLGSQEELAGIFPQQGDIAQGNHERVDINPIIGPNRPLVAWRDRLVTWGFPIFLILLWHLLS